MDVKLGILNMTLSQKLILVLDAISRGNAVILQRILNNTLI